MDRGEPEPSGGGLMISWRAITFAPAIVAMFALALYFNNSNDQFRGLACLGATFALAMVWLLLAARASENPASPMRMFIPRITAFIVLGTAFLGATRWSVDARITAMEAGFALFYIAAGWLAVRSFDARHRRPELKVVGGKKPPRRNGGKNR